MLSTVAVFATLTGLAALGCDDDALCEAGEHCECPGNDACYFECDGDGCDMACSSMVACGAVCENDCSLECHDMNDCTSSCGDNCTVDCHNLDDCGVICGASCNYSCHDVDRCGVRAGPNSTIDCTNVSSCVVECEGRCSVSCQGVGNGCTVRCAGGDDPISCSGSLRACGSCP